MAKNSLLNILNGLSEAVFLIDANRQIVLTNPQAVEIFGKGLEGQNIVRAIRHPDCLKATEEALAGAENSSAVIVLERPVPTTYQVRAAHLPEDDIFGAQAVLSLADISHVREAEQMRSDFVANVSHELRSPLTALSGFIETLQGPAKDDPSAQERFLYLMDREAQRMNRLIGDLLSLSKVEVNERVRPTGVADVVSIVRRIITTLSSQAEEDHKKVVFHHPDTVGPIPGDEDEILQVFQNLIENAIKYGAPDTEVTVTVDEVERAAGVRGPALSVTVQDRGPGISAEHIPRLTERFYRVDDSRSRDIGGTGLGLAIVKHIVSRHRGRLVIHSERDVGSSFTVLLPATTSAG